MIYHSVYVIHKGWKHQFCIAYIKIQYDQVRLPAGNLLDATGSTKAL